tara:strand:- start:606 stop:2156 length:1551 start_codon:yes stop_codon:yes gene_type:complete
MFGSNFKKFNSVLILFLVYISLKNITKFTDDSIEMPPQSYSYKFSQDDSSEWDSENQEYSDFGLDEDRDLKTSDIESEIKQSLKKRFELRKKTGPANDFQDIANYIDTEVASDYVYDQADANLNLVPVEETILFSGVPEPKIKPVPEKPEYSKSVIISIKNKKMLLKNLENYLDDDHFKFVYESLENSLNFKVEENLTFLMNEEDYVLEIQTFSKNFKNLNSRRDTNKKFIFYYEETPTERKVTRNRLIVKESVSRTLKSAEIPPEIAKEFIQQLSYTIDFQRDVKSGDIIDILYEADFTKNNNIVGTPDLLYGLMNLKDHKLELFRYTLSNGVTDYFDAYGKSIRKHLMRTPVQGARLSSKFGVRKHPILGYSKMHRGVDFAAKRGTPIMAAGDGRITFSGRNGAFGRFIEIKHLNNFKTGYAHLYKFAKGIKKGKLVKQGDIIGYVGTSGRSTGPHLHYEVKHKNRTINPMKLRLQSTINVEDKDMSNFYANISLARERFLATQFTESEGAENF